MFLAPSTLRDYIVTDEQAAEIERLEQRIEQLENSPTATRKYPVIKETLEWELLYYVFEKYQMPIVVHKFLLTNILCT